jgi:hypothetical protein
MFLAVLLVRFRKLISDSPIAQAALFLLVYVFLWKWQLAHKRDIGVVHSEIASVGDAIRQISAHPQWFRPGANVLIANDSFGAETPWTSSFISHLVAHDRSVRVHTLSAMQEKPSLAGLQKYTTVIAFENGRYVDVTARVLARGL